MTWPARRGHRIRDRAQEEPRRAATLHRGGAGHGTPGGGRRIRVEGRRVPSARSEEGASVGRVAHMGPGGLTRRKNREARAHADNDGRHEATRQDENTARHQTPYTLTAPPTRHHTTPLLRSIPGVHNKAQPQMSSGPARAAARQGPFRSGALDVVTAAGTGPDPISVISYQLSNRFVQ